MTQIIPIELEDGTIIYMEANDDGKQPVGDPKRGITPTEPQKQVPQHFQEIQKTVRAYTAYTLAAFKNW
jgi:hypothetical protein